MDGLAKGLTASKCVWNPIACCLRPGDLRYVNFLRVTSTQLQALICVDKPCAWLSGVLKLCSVLNYRLGSA